MDDSEMLALATEFTLIRRSSRRLEIGELRICQRNHDPLAWAIVDGAWVLNRAGDWEMEPMPSNRSDEFVQRCRWPSARAAIGFAQAHLERYPTGAKPSEGDDVSPSDALDY